MIIGLNSYMGGGKDTVGMIIQALTMQEGNWKNNPIGYLKAYEGRPNLKGGWQIKKFAGKLKQVASLLTGIPVDKFEDQEFKKSYLSHEWDEVSSWSVAHMDGKTIDQFMKDLGDGFYLKDGKVIRRMNVRQFLQKLGTEAIRNGLHTNAWVNALFADYKATERFPEKRMSVIPNWIITDTRFPNEAQAIKDKGGYVVRINRMKVANNIDGLGGVHLHPSETSLDNWKFDFVINNNGSLEELKDKVELMMDELGLIDNIIS